MNRIAALFSVALLLLISAPRLPAPIAEEQPSQAPGPQPAQPKGQGTAKNKKTESSRSNPVSRFNGAWQLSNPAGVFRLVIRNGNTAEWTAEFTNKLGRRKTWPTAVLPTTYNTVPSIYEKVIGTTTDLKLDGSNLRISWSQKKIVDWAPKTIPYNVLAASPLFGGKLTGNELYTLAGNQLIRINENGTTTRFNRTR